MHHFERTTGIKRVKRIGPKLLGGQHHEERPDALAGRKQRIANGRDKRVPLVEGRRKRLQPTINRPAHHLEIGARAFQADGKGGRRGMQRHRQVNSVTRDRLP